MTEILAVLGVALVSLSLGYVAGRASVRDALRSALTVAPLTTWVPRRVDTLDDGSRIVWGQHDHGEMYALAAGEPPRCRCGAVRYDGEWYSPDDYAAKAAEVSLFRLLDAAGVTLRVKSVEYLTQRIRHTACLSCAIELPPGVTWEQHEATAEHVAARAWHRG